MAFPFQSVRQRLESVIRNGPKRWLASVPITFTLRDSELTSSASSGSAYERAKRYRKLAEDAEALAKKAMFLDESESYLKYARRWRTLADESENAPWFVKL